MDSSVSRGRRRFLRLCQRLLAVVVRDAVLLAVIIAACIAVSGYVLLNYKSQSALPCAYEVREYGFAGRTWEVAAGIKSNGGELTFTDCWSGRAVVITGPVSVEQK